MAPPSWDGHDAHTIPPGAPTQRDLSYVIANGRRLRLDEAGIPIVTSEEDENATDTDKTSPFGALGLRTNERARFTVMTGQSAGMVIALDKEVSVIGRGKDSDVCLNDAGVSRRHATVTRKRGNYLLQDLKSTNGTLVNGRPTKLHALRVGDRVQVGPNVVLQFALFDDAEETLARRLYEASTRDALTGAYNRRSFLERFDAELSYAARHRTDAAIILIDIDHFKQVNDTYGHAAGDAVLRELSRLIATMSRNEDVFARLGGEEFVLLVRGIPPDDVLRFAQRIRLGVSNLVVEHGDDAIKATVSAGVANLRERDPVATRDELLSLADARLYRAKAAGRNRVCSTGD